MRIIGGTLKRTTIPSPVGTATRPTTDRMRESMFEVIGRSTDFGGIHVLDLYAGSGILTWEALSRGAQRATMVDSSAEICRHLRTVSISLGLGPQVEIIRADALGYLRAAAPVGIGCLFADPPYAARQCNSIVNVLCQGTVLNAGSLAVFEHGDQEFLMPNSLLASVWQGTFGASVIDILRRVDNVA